MPYHLTTTHSWRHTPLLQATYSILNKYSQRLSTADTPHLPFSYLYVPTKPLTIPTAASRPTFVFVNTILKEVEFRLQHTVYGAHITLMTLKMANLPPPKV